MQVAEPAQGSRLQMQMGGGEIGTRWWGVGCSGSDAVHPCFHLVIAWGQALRIKGLSGGRDWVAGRGRSRSSGGQNWLPPPASRVEGGDGEGARTVRARRRSGVVGPVESQLSGVPSCWPQPQALSAGSADGAERKQQTSGTTDHDETARCQSATAVTQTHWKCRGTVELKFSPPRMRRD